MRTTLDIDIDVLQAAKDRARCEKKTLGSVISALARSGLNLAADASSAGEPAGTYGFRPFPKRGGIVSNDMINKLREDDVY
jgi:hypothetical protein